MKTAKLPLCFCNTISKHTENPIAALVLAVDTIADVAEQPDEAARTLIDSTYGHFFALDVIEEIKEGKTCEEGIKFVANNWLVSDLFAEYFGTQDEDE
jgi:hypothetical protein